MMTAIISIIVIAVVICLIVTAKRIALAKSESAGYESIRLWMKEKILKRCWFAKWSIVVFAVACALELLCAIALAIVGDNWLCIVWKFRFGVVQIVALAICVYALIEKKRKLDFVFIAGFSLWTVNNVLQHIAPYYIRSMAIDGAMWGLLRICDLYMYDIGPWMSVIALVMVLIAFLAHRKDIPRFPRRLCLSSWILLVIGEIFYAFFLNNMVVSGRFDSYGANDWVYKALLAINVLWVGISYMLIVGLWLWRKGDSNNGSVGTFGKDENHWLRHGVAVFLPLGLICMAIGSAILSSSDMGHVYDGNLILTKKGVAAMKWIRGIMECIWLAVIFEMSKMSFVAHGIKGFKRFFWGMVIGSCAAGFLWEIGVTVYYMMK